jgi:hypothetical protein
MRDRFGARREESLLPLLQTQTAGGAVVFDLRTDAPAPALPEGWSQRPFPADRPAYHFPVFGNVLFAGTAPGVVTDPRPWEALAGEMGEKALVFSAFLPPVTLGGLGRMLRARGGMVRRSSDLRHWNLGIGRLESRPPISVMVRRSSDLRHWNLGIGRLESRPPI